MSISFYTKIKIISNKAQHDYEDTKHVFDKIVWGAKHFLRIEFFLIDRRVNITKSLWKLPFNYGEKLLLLY